MEREDINALKSAYRELFEEGQPLQEVAQRLFESTNSEKVKQLCKFIMTSKRGIPFTRTKTNEDN
jgi:UDP-N-acetylglucosamine acyltransferase